MGEILSIAPKRSGVNTIPDRYRGERYGKSIVRTDDGRSVTIIDHPNGGQTVIHEMPFSRNILYATQSARGIGTTTAQIRNAAEGAYYVCGHTHNMDHCHKLALQTGRTDLVLVSWMWVPDRRYLGCKAPQVVIDHHAFEIQPEYVWKALHHLAAWVNR